MSSITLNSQITNEQIAMLINQNEMLISLLKKNIPTDSFDLSNDSSSESTESVLSLYPDTSDESYVESELTTDSETISEDSLCEESGKPIPQKTVRKLMKFAVGGKSSYTPKEVEQMDDFTLTREFIRITGYDKLNCKHCKHPTTLDNWIVSIRKRCLKKDGLSVKTKIPKTCDQQQAVNTMRNPVNNKVYPIMRASTLYWEDYTTKAAAMNRKAVLFNEIGLKINPYKYKVFN